MPICSRFVPEQGRAGVVGRQNLATFVNGDGLECRLGQPAEALLGLGLQHPLRVVLTPDDNADHCDDPHLETYPGKPRLRPGRIGTATRRARRPAGSPAQAVS
jgi:hypothetical protein